MGLHLSAGSGHAVTLPEGCRGDATRCNICLSCKACAHLTMRMQEQNKAVTMKGRSFHPVVVVDVVGNEQAGETIQKGETLESAWIACSPDLNHLGKKL